MTQRSMVGTRIRERRVMSGRRQSELAQSVGISASYLNLIEHNRRRIGGKTLLKIAEALNVEPALLSQGAEATLVDGLREAAATHEAASPELDRIEEFAGRFPGWARLLSRLNENREELERTVKTLTDRLAHDPHLAASLHEVISTVTAIRSTASILAETKALEPEWQNRFHRNINEDSRRLAEGAEALVRYLEGAPDTDADIKSPQDELHAFLVEHGFHFPDLEGTADNAAIEDLLDASRSIETGPARRLATNVLKQYVRDAGALPQEVIGRSVDRHGTAPDAIAQETGAEMTMVFRRLAMLPERMVGPVGLLICDASGALLLRKPVLGFAAPRTAAACVVWPLYQVLTQPARPVRERLRQGDVTVLSMAAAELVAPAAFDTPLLIRPHMLILPVDREAANLPLRDVGAHCRICPLQDCRARREPSILSEGF